MKVRRRFSVLFEQTHKPRVDREAGIIFDCKIIGKRSKNNRDYTDEALLGAIPLYEGMLVNVDHPRDANGKLNRLIPRKSHERFGVMRNVINKPDGDYGDLHFLKSHPMAGPICEAAERFPEAFALSHNADGIGPINPATGRQQIVEIFDVKSIDVVVDGGTTDGLFEQELPAMLTFKTVLDAWRKKWAKAKHANKEKLAKGLCEDADVMDAEAVTDQPADSDEALDAAFSAAGMSIFSDATLNKAEKIAKLKTLLDAQEKLGATSDAPAETADDSTEEEEPVKKGGKNEQADPTLAALQAKIDALEVRQEVLGLCEQHDFRPKSHHVKALCAAGTDTERLALLEDFTGAKRKEPPAGGGKKKDTRSGYQRTAATDDDDDEPSEDEVKAFATRLTRR